jgi:CDP-diacylglycerol--glycerol-3-phosphate 3-phosphatidyltransferase
MSEKDQLTWKKKIDQWLLPLTKVCLMSQVSPNMITSVGLFISIFALFFLIKQNLLMAGITILVSGFFDILDGATARNHNLYKKFGAFWDSTADRFSEALIFLGLIVFFYQNQQFVALILTFIVCLLSQMVSYTRARAEGLGVECKVGVLPRTGRVLLLSIGLLTNYVIFILWIIMVLSLITIIQRIVWNWQCMQ